MKMRMEHRCLLLLLAVLLGAFSMSAKADVFDELYGTGIGTVNLYRLNQTTGVGTTQYASYPPGGGAISAAMAQRPSDGMIFYIGGQSGNDRVYRWNPTTPATAPVLLGQTGAGMPYMPRMTFAQNDVLYAMDTNGQHLYTIDQATGAATQVSTYSNPVSGGGDLTFAPDGTLYFISGATLYTIPLAGGSITTLGNITGGGAAHPGMAYNSQGQLVIIDSATPANLYTLNVSTLVATRVGAVGAPGTSFGDLASAPGQYITGTVFEDVNYGGGAGRSLAASGGVGRANARVELYDPSGNFIVATTTDATGKFTLSGAAGHKYYVRVVNSSVTSSRTGYVAGMLPVQTYRTDAASGGAVAVTDHVGGKIPSSADAGQGAIGTAMNVSTGAFTAGIAGQAQSFTAVQVGTTIGGTISSVDFGFNFDTVVNTNDTGQGSLRQVITNANGLSNAGLAQAGLVAGRDNAVFMISNGTAAAGLRAANNYFASGIATIAPLSALTTVTDPVVIDATIQPGFVSTPVVELNGAGAGATADGLAISAGSSTVRGLIINRFNQSGIALSSGGGNTIQGNYLGTNPAGTASSQNDQQGIYINGSATNTIGGTTTAARNVISGNRLRGILIANAGATGNIIRGNYVGINAAGTGAVANIIGIFVSDIGSNTIGGTAAGAGNVVSGNTQIGIYLVSPGATGNLVQGNKIGLDAAGTTVVANGTHGVDIILGASNNTVGGVAAGAANSIAGNGDKGVRVTGGTGNRIQRNSIYGNTNAGIDLGTDNVTANNGTVSGALPNNGMDYPVFTVSALTGATLSVAGYVGSAPGQAAFANATIEIFKADNTPADQNGEIISGDGKSVAHGEGKTYLGTITADASGNFNTTLAVSGLALGDAITATATDGSGNTSEFGGNATVTTAGVNVSGTVYKDANHNLQIDTGETGTGLTLYAKIFPTSSPAGPATQAVAVDPATGAYSLTGVQAGSYTIVIDDNNTLSDVTPTLPAGWSGTEMPDRTRTNVSVAGTPVPNMNFGIIHAMTLSGRVFADSGAGGGTANDGILSAGESGVAGATVKLTDSTGATVYDTAASDGAGNFTLLVPNTLAAGTQLKITETNPKGYLSTGGSAGTTGGSYDRASDTITFALAANTAYTGVNFGDVPDMIFTTDGQQANLPGTIVIHTHTFTAGSAGQVTFSVAGAANPSLPGWTQTLYRDVNNNSAIDPGDTPITGAITLTAGQAIQILVKEFIPVNAPFNAQDKLTVTATFSYTNATPALASSATHTDITTVGNPTTAGLAIVKSVDKSTARPGETITYTITFTNNSSDTLSNVVIYDSTPAFTTFASASNGALPPGLTSVALIAPAVGATGSIRWTFTGTLAPAGTGTVTFRVVLDQ